MGYCKICIIGNLGRDAEMRYTPDGTAICNFSVAVSEKYKDKETTVWFKVNIWGKLGEAICGYLLKGKQIYVEGGLKTEEWTDQKSGEKKFNLAINASVVQLLGNKNDGGQSASGSGSGHQHPEPQAKQPENPYTPPATADGGDDIPF